MYIFWVISHLYVSFPSHSLYLLCEWSWLVSGPSLLWLSVVYLSICHTSKSEVFLEPEISSTEYPFSETPPWIPHAHHGCFLPGPQIPIKIPLVCFKPEPARLLFPETAGRERQKVKCVGFALPGGGARLTFPMRKSVQWRSKARLP